MKFCSKCGGQMEDHAAFCPNCGAPAGAASAGAASGQPGDSASRLLAEKKHSRITSAMVLNVLAFLLSLVACVILFFLGAQRGTDPPDDSYTIEHDLLGEFLGYDTAKIVTPDEKMAEWAAKEAERRESNEALLKALGLWQGISLAAMAVGFFAARGAKKNKKGLVFLFMALWLLPAVALGVIFPQAVVLLFCGIGLILFVPAILGLIAGGKLLQAANIRE